MSNNDFEALSGCYEPPKPIKYGWVCPKCKRVYSPEVNECFVCNEAYNRPGEPGYTTLPYVPTRPWINSYNPFPNVYL